MNLYRTTVRGLLVSLVSQGGAGILQFISTIILARLLHPSDFGLVAMAASILGFISICRNFGGALAVVQAKNLTKNQFNTLVSINVLVGIVITLLLVNYADLVTYIYPSSELPKLFRVYSIELLFSGLAALYSGLLLNQLAFKKNALCRLISVLIGLIVSVVFSLLKYGAMSIVYGLIVTSIVHSVLCYILSGWSYSIPCRPYNIRGLFKFGCQSSLSNVFSFTGRSFDDVLIGRCFGGELLGMYNKSYNLIMLPLRQIRMPLTNVIYPILSKLDPLSKEYKEYFYGMLRVLALLTMPLMAFCYSASHEIVSLLLGPQWVGAVPLFEILALAVIIQPVSSMRGIVLLSNGKSGAAMKLSAVSMLLTVCAFLLGYQWGIIGMCWAYVIFSWIEMLPMYYYSIRETSLSLFGVVENIYNIVLLSCLSAVLAEFVDVFYLNNVVYNVFLKMIIFTIVFSLFVFLSKTWRKDVVKFIRMINARRL